MNEASKDTGRHRVVNGASDDIERHRVVNGASDDTGRHRVVNGASNDIGRHRVVNGASDDIGRHRVVNGASEMPKGSESRTVLSTLQARRRCAPLGVRATPPSGASERNPNILKIPLAGTGRRPADVVTLCGDPYVAWRAGVAYI